MGNGCFNSIESPIRHAQASELSIFGELRQKQSQICYPLKLETLDSFEEGFFQKEFTFIEQIIPSLIVASTQTQTIHIDEHIQGYSNASTQTQNIAESEKRMKEYVVGEASSKLRLFNKTENRQNKLTQQNAYKTAMKQTNRAVNHNQNRNSQVSLEKYSDRGLDQNNRYQTPNQKNVRFADSKFSLPVL